MKMIPPVIVWLLAPLAWAGEVRSSKAPIPQPVEQSLWQWFTGASVGYLVDFEEPFYSAHVGVDTPYKVLGFDVALYLEVGYTKKDIDGLVPDIRGGGGGGGDDNVGRAGRAVVLPGTTALDASLEIIPLTFNVKFERQLTDSFNVYFGAGVGVAFTDFHADINYRFSPDVHVSKSDTVFAAQIFAGMIYNVTPNFEVFSGVRWIYVDFPGTGGVPGTRELDFDSDVLVELGARYTF